MTRPFHLLRRAIPAALLAACGVAFAPATFAAWDTNLLANPGADAVVGGNGEFADNLPGWTVSGELTAIDYSLGCPGGYPCLSDPVPPTPGANHFGGGYAGVSSGRQRVDLGFANAAAGGLGAYYSLSGWLGGYAGQEDYATLVVTFRDAADQSIGSATIGPVNAADRGNVTAMLLRQSSGWVPVGAVSADVEIAMTRTGGSSNDGYADSLGFTVREANTLLSAPGSARVGSTFSTTVSAYAPFAGERAGDELLAFGFDVGFDTSLLRLTGIAMAPGFDDDSAAFTDIDVAGSAFPGVADARQGQLDLAVLTFEVIGTGQAFIDISSDAGGNLSEGLVYLGTDSRDVFGRTAVMLTPVPEPSTFVLGALGIAALGLRRRRA